MGVSEKVIDKNIEKWCKGCREMNNKRVSLFWTAPTTHSLCKPSLRTIPRWRAVKFGAGDDRTKLFYSSFVKLYARCVVGPSRRSRCRLFRSTSSLQIFQGCIIYSSMARSLNVRHVDLCRDSKYLDGLGGSPAKTWTETETDRLL